MINWAAVFEICTMGPLLLFWLWVVLGFGVARPIYRKHYKNMHGHYPSREDVARWLWVLLSLSPTRMDDDVSYPS